MKVFRAPWSASLIAMSCLGVALCAVVGFSQWRVIAAAQVGRLAFWGSLLPIALVLGAALFSILQYTVTKDEILIRRLLWSTRLPLQGLVSIESQPEAMRGSWRTFGNGGLFSFTGFYRNAHLGSFRAFVTDPARSVVLRYAGRTVVLSPGEPERFVEAVRTGAAT